MPGLGRTLAEQEHPHQSRSPVILKCTVCHVNLSMQRPLCGAFLV